MKTNRVYRKIDKNDPICQVRHFTTGSNKGFVLIEIIIALSIFIIIIPSIFYTYITTEKLILNNICRMQKEKEMDYLCSFLRQDLKTATDFSQSVNSFSFTNQDLATISYYIEDSKLKRKTTGVNKKSQTLIINNDLKIINMVIEKTPFLLDLDLKSDLGENKIRIMLPNE
ncbi:MAG: hypothetical protein WC860_02245 [Candidatus Margulisiibacteriota bacterium]|jgi:hypothetical protein